MDVQNLLQRSLLLTKCHDEYSTLSWSSNGLRPLMLVHAVVHGAYTSASVARKRHTIRALIAFATATRASYCIFCTPCNATSEIVPPIGPYTRSKSSSHDIPRQLPRTVRSGEVSCSAPEDLLLPFFPCVISSPGESYCIGRPRCICRVRPAP